MEKTLQAIPKSLFAILLLSVLVTASGCATNPFEQEVVSQEQQAWMQSIVSYQNGSIDTESVFAISDDMQALIKEKFGHQRKGVAIENLARWLMSSEGHNMQYHLAANLTPIDAFEQKLGNCLSFTILLVNLAKVIDVKLDYNDVHLANAWGMDDEGDGVTLFRHVNAIRRNFERIQIFDLAIEQYDYGLPQRIITEQQALAGLYSNISVEKLKDNDIESALHHIKLSIALFPKKSDFWVNLGVVYKKNNKLINAERSFLHALNLNDADSVAASNLEKLYTQQGQLDKAAYFKKRAFYARQKNPYVHYNQANNYLKLRKYNLAKKSITKAKKLHNQDPRFFVLSSMIEQHQNDYVSAIKDILKAYTLTVDNKERSNYSQKAQLLALKSKSTKERNQVNYNDLLDLTTEE